MAVLRYRRWDVRNVRAVTCVTELIDNVISAFSSQLGQAVFHLPNLLDRMAGPLHDLRDHAKWLSRPIRHCRIAGEFLVRQVWVIYESACRLNDVDPWAVVAASELRSPNCGVEGARKINP